MAPASRRRGLRPAAPAATPWRTSEAPQEARTALGEVVVSPEAQEERRKLIEHIEGYISSIEQDGDLSMEEQSAQIEIIERITEDVRGWIEQDAGGAS